MPFKSDRQRKAVMAKYKIYFRQPDLTWKYDKTIKIPVKGTIDWATKLGIKVKKIRD